MSITIERANGALPNQFIAFDTRGGLMRIGSFLTGAVRRADGVPLAGRVCVREASGGFGQPVISIITTDGSGNWELAGLTPEKRYRAEIRDPTRQLNGAVLDWIQPVPM